MKRYFVVVDVESDGPIPHKYSMVCFGAVIVEPELSRTFYGQTRPISKEYDSEALSISGFSRVEHEKFSDPLVVMQEFRRWLKEQISGRPIFISDNPAYDWQFINYYFHYFLGENPFGYSARRIGDLYCGMMKNCSSRWKHFRVTKHDHNPVNDAKGNAEVLLQLKDQGLIF